MNTAPTHHTTGFHTLDINDILDAVENTTGQRFTNLCRSLNSYINRVYELQPENGPPIIAKFYRPGRWSHQALQDEHLFLTDLHQAEVPVIPPWADPHGNTLFQTNAIHYALFPKRGGLLLEEPKPDQWKELGRLLARMHLVGHQYDAEHRITMTPDQSMQQHIDHILTSHHIPLDILDPYQDILEHTLDLIDPLFDHSTLQRIHGDLHYQNIIYRPNEGLLLIDFDDMAIGPPVQDLWMLLPGRVQDCLTQLDTFIQGYQTFMPFNTAELKLIEALRCMRFVHYSSWCIHQAQDGGFKKLGDQWGTSAYWRREIQDLQTQLHELEDSLNTPTHF